VSRIARRFASLGDGLNRRIWASDGPNSVWIGGCGRLDPQRIGKDQFPARDQVPVKPQDRNDFEQEQTEATEVQSFVLEIETHFVSPFEGIAACS
jgi:hypothetical protein